MQPQLTFLSPFPPCALSGTSRRPSVASRRQVSLRPCLPRRRRRSLLRLCAAPSSDVPFADKKAALLTALRAVVDPDLGDDIVSLGFVKNIDFRDNGDVSFDVELTTPACPVKDAFRQQCQQLAESLPFVREAHVRMTAQAPRATAELTDANTRSLQRVSNVILVASAKGGVAKSTTAVNLAYVLSRSGARVGILDADIYGPSLPIMVAPEGGTQVRLTDDGLIEPFVRAGVKLMSFGYINPDPAMLRGPMVASMVTQLVQQTHWGELDYLVVDMPPGTGDVQITLGQVLKATAAVVVTTPQRLAFADVVKGIQLLDKLAVPPIAVVESMAYFEAPDTGRRYYLFGQGHGARLSREFGIENTFEVPLMPEINAAGDTGTPITLTTPEDNAVFQCYKRIADAVVQECARIRFGANTVPQAHYDTESGDIVVRIGGANDDDAHVEHIWPAALRRACRCAACVDEYSGAPLLDPGKVDENVRPQQMMNVGNYALAINWSDSHQSIMPWERILTQYRSRRRSTPAPAPEPSTPAPAAR
ncbi:hypothetical protein CDCA_CDCA14G3931 [Cyanidium caldarium]|uniref:MIP18 family-like domain-containing protein n=1 Tax=Cyanidium caldarium TaxID=2771 RepID=A0AAV9J0J3_CYACA|nr:hypothetical protein CDCA_CDCA14G3931 [Cyanidium caldarium]